MSIYEYYTDVWLPKLEKRIQTTGYPKGNRDPILKFETYLFCRRTAVPSYSERFDCLASGKQIDDSILAI